MLMSHVFTKFFYVNLYNLIGFYKNIEGVDLLLHPILMCLNRYKKEGERERVREGEWISSD